MKTTTVLYHSDNDGFGAAYAAWTKYGDKAHYIPVQYGQPVPKIPVGTKELFILDFSYNEETCGGLMEKYATVIIDHHKTAQAVLDHLPHTIFNMRKSGAVLAWEFFWPQDTEPPLLLQYVQDYDLWKFELPHSKEINLFLSTLGWDFEVWDRYAKNNALFHKAGMDLGGAVLRFRSAQVDYALKQARMMYLGKHKVPVVNASANISEIGNRLCKEYPDAPFSVSYCDCGGEVPARTWSLRSIGEFDVSEVAKAMGGGGHKNAAGFSTWVGWPEATAPEFEQAFIERAASLEIRRAYYNSDGMLCNADGSRSIFDDVDE